MDETDSGTMPDSIYADNSAVPRVADLPRQYAFGTWNNACIKRSAENCTAVRTGFKRKGEYDKPLFSIPTHHFLFFPGNINPKDFEDALMVEPNEYALIKFGERGTCLYRCGNERYLLLVQAPEYKAEIFGSAGGR